MINHSAMLLSLLAFFLLAGAFELGKAEGLRHIRVVYSDCVYPTSEIAKADCVAQGFENGYPSYDGKGNPTISCYNMTNDGTGYASRTFPFVYKTGEK